MIKEINPQWVKVNDQIRRVSDYAHLPPSLRPKVRCPLCLEPVIMKLGQVKFHHYAHQPDRICVATQPETALHLNTKFHIYEQLLSGKQLYLGQQCSSGCENRRTVSWIKDWEGVELEFTIGSSRPDILIRNSDGTNNAIEIKVTHPVGDAKETFYREQNIAWLEVEGCESIYEGENAWRIDQPLPFVVCKPPLPKWTCNDCLKEEEAELKEKRKAEYQKHNYKDILYSKLVDYYYPTNLRYRETYYLWKVVRNDESVGIFVQKMEDYKVLVKYGEVNDSNIELAKEFTKSEIESRREEYNAIVDDWEWLPWVSGTKYYAPNLKKYPFLYEWDGNLRKWVKKEQQKSYPEYRHTLIPRDGGRKVPYQSGNFIIKRDIYLKHPPKKDSPGSTPGL